MLIHSTHRTFDHIVDMVKYHWSKNPLYADAVIVLGYQHCGDIESFKNKYPNKKIIAYQLEQLHHNSPWANTKGIVFLYGCDEVWDYDKSNVEILKSRGINAKFQPVLHTPSLKKIEPATNEICDIDAIFYGYCNPRRMQILSIVMEKLNYLKFIVINQVWGDELDTYIKRSKVIINIHAYDGAPQEQVRMLYPIINGRCVLSEPSPINYLGDSILECRTSDFTDFLLHLIQTDNWLKQAKNSETELLRSLHTPNRPSCDYL